ncbi:glutathione S-transferase family protein [Allohahella marinimesophila]|uniref:Glutathione S-transferase family protein n=1 Tax=Allohahella marinimesophila TaxID=1054972 RepID=A0ABP7P831_9GAMM
MKLVIGNKNYSSWSLRPWLLLRAHDIDFEEIMIQLATAATASEIDQYNSAGKVPVLLDQGLTVWDSLAICEYVSEHYLAGKGWPADPARRAEARACSAEMHAGFASLREAMPMNCRASGRRVLISDALARDIERIDALWSQMLQRHGGPWLFGEFSIADCMFAPVVFRFSTYAVDISSLSRTYMDTALAHPAMLDWLSQARAEAATIDRSEVGR